MFNWLGNLFPYSDLHSLNLDWLLSKMKETAAQAAKAIADSANALAQVIEAKTAAQDAETAAQNAQTAANKAAGNAANAAANAVQALNAAQRAQETATAADDKAQTAQETANTAQSAAQTAQNTANTAQSAAQTAQNTANTAQSAAETAQTNIEALNGKFPIKTKDIADKAVTQDKMYTVTARIITEHRVADDFVLIPDSSGGGVYDISRITDELSPSMGAFMLWLLGAYMQCEIRFERGPNVADEDIKGSFGLLYWPDRRATNYAAYTPFVIENFTKNTVMRGYARLKTVDGDNFKFQMFFDEPPVFTETFGFQVTIRKVGTTLSGSF